MQKTSRNQVTVRKAPKMISCGSSRNLVVMESSHGFPTAPRDHEPPPHPPFGHPLPLRGGEGWGEGGRFTESFPQNWFTESENLRTKLRVAQTVMDRDRQFFHPIVKFQPGKGRQRVQAEPGPSSRHDRDHRHHGH